MNLATLSVRDEARSSAASSTRGATLKTTGTIELTTIVIRFETTGINPKAIASYFK